jgi:hypothetical protein
MGDSTRTICGHRNKCAIGISMTCMRATIADGYARSMPDDYARFAMRPSTACRRESVPELTRFCGIKLNL